MGNSYEQTQEVRGDDVPVLMLLELSEEEGWKPAAWNLASIKRIKRDMVEGEADGERRNKDIESTAWVYEQHEDEGTQLLLPCAWAEVS